MRKPKIGIVVGKFFESPTWWAEIRLESAAWNLNVWSRGDFPSRKAAREWAKGWCRTAGAALLVAGREDADAALRKLLNAKSVQLKEKGK